jgi:hypothetical protein
VNRRKSRWWSWLVLFKLDCWSQFHRYNARWDRELTELLRAQRFYEVTRFTAKIGDRTVWVENFPYSCFYPYDYGLRLRPRRSTILWAWHCLLEDVAGDPKDDEVAELERLYKQT